MVNSVVVWGTGVDAARCIYELSQRDMEIEYCVEEAHKPNRFYCYDLYEADLSHVRNKFVAVAVPMERYLKIKKKLNELGLIEFEDFVHYELLYKKMAILHGNCHMDIVGRFLNLSIAFKRSYMVYPNQAIHLNAEGRIDECVLRHCDLWIHQDIRSDVRYGYLLSDEGIRGKLKETSQGCFLFPQTEKGCRRKKEEYVYPPIPTDNHKDKVGMFPETQTDYLINDWIMDCYGEVEEIVRHCMEKDAIAQDSIKKLYEREMDRLRRREAYWDIKISDYIEENYKRRRLFHDHEHPTNEVLKRMAEGVLVLLGIKEELPDIPLSLARYENPVYPCTQKALGLEWMDAEYHPGNRTVAIRETLDTEEYIRQYVWWRYGNQKARMVHILRNRVAEGCQRFVVVPYGNRGKYMGRLLEKEFGETVQICFADNHQFDNETVYELDKLPFDEGRTCYLLATIRKEIAGELYAQLRKKVSVSDIIHILDVA